MHVLMTTRQIDEMDMRTGFVVRWVRALAARVDHLSIICQERGAGTLPSNVTVTSLGKERGQGRARQLAAFYRAAWRAVPRADVIFCHMIPRYAWLIAPVARLRGRRVVLWFTHRTASAELRLTLMTVDRVLTAAPDSFPLHSDKVTAIGHGIDTTLFHPAAAPGEAVPPQIVVVARLSPSKYHRTLIGAAARLRKRGELPDAKFVIAGGPTAESPGYRAELEREIAQHGLESRFEFVGGVPYSAVPDLYRRAAVAINLSPPGHFDKAALEAMLCGTPVIVANPAYTDLLGAHAHALTIAGPGDAEGLADRLASLLKAGPARRAQMGAELRQATAAAHSLEGLMDRLVAEFAALSHPPDRTAHVLEQDR